MIFFLIFPSVFRSGSGQQDPVAVELVFPERSLLGCRRVHWLVVSSFCLHVCSLFSWDSNVDFRFYIAVPTCSLVSFSP